MKWLSPTRCRRGLVMACGLTILCMFFGPAERSGDQRTTAAAPLILRSAVATPVSSTAHHASSELFRIDPLAYLQKARRDYENRVRDYVCTFTKQELLAGRLTTEQIAEAKFREGPFSVYMHITRNPGRARRLLYVQDRVVKSGKQHLIVEPEGPIARLLVKSVQRPVDGKDARRASRRLITEFGFARSLDLLIKYAVLSDQQGRLDVRYVGEGEIDGRPTHILERRLPYDDDNSEWPDARVIIHMDQEWDLPVACFCYADADCRELLGKYLYTNVHLNVGLQDVDFDPQTYGL